MPNDAFSAHCRSPSGTSSVRRESSVWAEVPERARVRWGYDLKTGKNTIRSGGEDGASYK